MTLRLNVVCSLLRASMEKLGIKGEAYQEDTPKMTAKNHEADNSFCACPQIYSVCTWRRSCCRPHGFLEVIRSAAFKLLQKVSTCKLRRKCRNRNFLWNMSVGNVHKISTVGIELSIDKRLCWILDLRKIHVTCHIAAVQHTV